MSGGDLASSVPALDQSQLAGDSCADEKEASVFEDLRASDVVDYNSQVIKLTENDKVTRFLTKPEPGGSDAAQDPGAKAGAPAAQRPA